MQSCIQTIFGIDLAQACIYPIDQLQVVIILSFLVKSVMFHVYSVYTWNMTLISKKVFSGSEV